MAKVMLATGLIVGYGYLVEIFIALYSGNQYESFMILNRIQGPYRWHWMSLLLCNILVPQLLWMKRVRNSALWVWIIAMFVNVGMWLERFVIIVTSLHRDFLPSSWGMYSGSRWDWMLFIGTIGLFLSLHLPLHPLPAHDLDLRDAHARAEASGAGADRREGRACTRLRPRGSTA